MKRLTLFLGILAVFNFCTKENESSELISLEEEINSDLITESPDNSTDYSKFKGKWELVKIYGTQINVELVGEEISEQGYYLFDDNGRFKKSQENEGVTSEFYGTYFSKEFLEGNYLILTYESEPTIIANCASRLQELLLIKPEILTNDLWIPCDGPGLEYSKIDR